MWRPRSRSLHVGRSQPSSGVDQGAVPGLVGELEEPGSRGLQVLELLRGQAGEDPLLEPQLEVEELRGERLLLLGLRKGQPLHGAVGWAIADHQGAGALAAARQTEDLPGAGAGARAGDRARAG